jgi:hypothetical protein
MYRWYWRSVRHDIREHHKRYNDYWNNGDWNDGNWNNRRGDERHDGNRANHL